MAGKIGGRVELEGEREFRSALKGLEAQTKLFKAELKQMVSSFSEQTTAQQKAEATSKLFANEIQNQKNKVAQLAKMVEKASKAYGENSSEVIRYKTQLANAKAELNQTVSAQTKLGEEVDNSADKAGGAANAFRIFGETLKAHLAHDAIVTGLKAIGNAVTSVAKKLVVDTVSSFGELEQALGGAESVFAEFHKEIVKSGENSYKTMGVSQTEYIATANKMGALFQGSGLSVQRSAELTTQAMARAADMASVMGIDTTDALNAVSNAAKGQYNMMDNLGIAMNDTTLKAYALEQGYEKAFNQMSQAEKAEVAMKYFFEKSSKYAGNFEKEARTTITGSFGMLKASISSFTAALGNPDADIRQFAVNISDSFQAVGENILRVLPQIFESLPVALESFFPIFNQTISKLGEAFLSLLPGMLENGGKMLQSLIDGMVTNMPLISQMVSDLMANLVVFFISNLPSILLVAAEIITSLIDGLLSGIARLFEPVAEIVSGMVESFNKRLKSFMEIGKNVVKGLWDGIKSMGSWIADKVSGFFGGIVDAAKNALGIHSPSRVFAGLGSFSAEGYGIGFQKKFKDVSPLISRSMQSPVYSIMNNFNFNGGSYEERDGRAIIRIFDEELGGMLS